MKICAVADLHGNLPELPSCDLLLIAGDVTPTRNHSLPFQEAWLENNFRIWLKNLDAKHVCFIFGNHDFIGQERAALIRQMFQDVPNVHFLQDDYCYVEDLKKGEDLKIYGTPWQPIFFDWAFNASEEVLEQKWSRIPDDTDILIVHGPPHGYGDLAARINEDKEWGEHVGSPSLLARIQEIKPKLVVCGHIHRGYGVYEIEGQDTKVINCSILDEKYRMVNSPWVGDL